MIGDLVNRLSGWFSASSPKLEALVVAAPAATTKLFQHRYLAAASSTVLKSLDRWVVRWADISQSSLLADRSFPSLLGVHRQGCSRLRLTSIGFVRGHRL